MPESLALKISVVLDKSPLNQKIIQGEPFVTGSVSSQEMFQFGEDLAAAGIQSVLFVPLKVEHKVIGILSIYSKQADHFHKKDVSFFQQAADLVAIAIENARAYESVQHMMEERSRFMLRVAHNLRAPLAAGVSLLDVLRDGYLGEVNERQQEYLGRLERRIRSLLSLVNDLMSLAQNRSEHQSIPSASIDLKKLAQRLYRCFRASAGEKKLHFKVLFADDLPPLTGHLEALEQMMENLVSNAIKYTPAGSVQVHFSAPTPTGIRIEVRDTGIGIPAEDQDRLFVDFFRAGNARAIEVVGTGLGLAIVKETVDNHQGRIEVKSQIGTGSVFRVDLPSSDPEAYDGQGNESASKS